MATYIILGNYTEQGVGQIKDSPKRLDAARASAKSLGVTLKDFYLCMGDHDFVVIAESNSDESVAQFILTLGVDWQRANYDHPCLHGGAMQEDCRSAKMNAG